MQNKELIIELAELLESLSYDTYNQCKLIFKSIFKDNPKMQKIGEDLFCYIESRRPLLIGMK